MRRKLAAGNWKMNGTAAQLAELTAMTEVANTEQTDVLICTPATLVNRAADTASGSAVAIGGQDCHANASGAHTGDISAAMLADAGASHVITGHSERRVDHAETDAVIAAKSEAAYANDLIAVICIGESLQERESGQTLDVVGTQLQGSTPDAATGANTVIAYEPVWAIGTGKVPTLDQIAEVHDFIRAKLVERFGAEGEAIRVLYGGSVKPSNASEIFAVSNVDGALVGGASLKASDFNAIISALDEA
ncbi:triose-phosphate isomerase [Cognatishimia activa]|uniref:triose-phosphate isomerase n=1 Tax=Cognatishimia activa TaxID=1715691 RepID=UPI00222F11AC|nr:triose-phosphate isomerase [Cognatishimia activa]UZD92254.1 triose-phosphate isomerase [Cognatishimia activa]